jgi:hypothetical protein
MCDAPRLLNVKYSTDHNERICYNAARMRMQLSAKERGCLDSAMVAETTLVGILEE